MPDNQSTMSPLQKEVYTGTVNELVNSDDFLIGQFEKESADGGGPTAASANTTSKMVHFEVHLGRNATGGFFDPEASFPSSGNQVYKQGQLQGRTMYWPTQVSRAIIERTKTDAAAYARAMIENATRTGNDVRNEGERIFLGDGSGTLGVNTATAAVFSSNTMKITLDNAADARKFWKGQIITAFTGRTNAATQATFITTGTGTPTTAARVLLVDLTAGTITFEVFPSTLNGGNGGTWTASTGVDGQAGVVFVKGNDYGATTQQGARSTTLRHEFMGLNGIVSDCDTPMDTGGSNGLHGILAPKQYGSGIEGAGGSTNATGEALWASYCNRAAAGRSISDGIMQSLVDRPFMDYGQKPDLFVMPFGGRWEYVATKIGIRRTVNTISVSGQTGGGFSENQNAKNFVEYDEIPIIPSRYAPQWFVSPTVTCSVLAINRSALKIKQWHPVRFMDVDGLTWRMVGRTPFFEAILEWTLEPYTTARNAHSKATAILASDFT